MEPHGGKATMIRRRLKRWTGRDVPGRRLQRKRPLIPTAASPHPPSNAPHFLPNLQILTEFRLTPCCSVHAGSDAYPWYLKHATGSMARFWERPCHPKPRLLPPEK